VNAKFTRRAFALSHWILRTEERALSVPACKTRSLKARMGRQRPPTQTRRVRPSPDTRDCRPSELRRHFPAQRSQGNVQAPDVPNSAHLNTGSCDAAALNSDPARLLCARTRLLTELSCSSPKSTAAARNARKRHARRSAFSLPRIRARSAVAAKPIPSEVNVAGSGTGAESPKS
jgi:hypothetical protein